MVDVIAAAVERRRARWEEAAMGVGDWGCR